jgi:AAA+ ATPase superfamily predicted ATPase
MQIEINPFVVTGRIPTEYFCDRIQESTRLVKSITNGNNVVLISPRRMGKTGLIQFCYENAKIKDNYYCFFVDILHTSSLRELTYVLGKTVFETLTPLSKKMANKFVEVLKSISGKFGFDAATGMPTFNIELGDIEQPEYTLEEIFKLLSEADKPCIVAIDEFQQINKYPEKNIEALLRMHIQKMSNCNFIYAGSERSIMRAMFLSSARPFYMSADIMELNAIAKKVYTDFIVNNFAKRNRKTTPEIASYVYDIFEGHTFYIQKTFNEAFADTLEGGECTKESIGKVIDEMIGLYDTIFREILSNIPERQKELLYAIAKAGKANQILSSSFIKRYKLDSASSVQSAAKKLLEMDIINNNDKTYSVTDKLMGIWIRREFGE